jgi:hypothetical protein
MAEASDEIQVEFSEFQSCVQAVKTASCDSDMAKAAFKTDSYEGSGLILRSSPSCSQALFSKK